MRPRRTTRSGNFHLAGERALARGWPVRARDNIAAISLSKILEQSGGTPTPDEQARLPRFIGLGASELAQNCFRCPGEEAFRPEWLEIGAKLEAAVTPEEYASLPIIRALWRAAERLGFCGGRVLEPGMGTGLFFALLPTVLRDACQLTGIEYDPVVASLLAQWQLCAHVGRSGEVAHFSKAAIGVSAPSGGHRWVAAARVGRHHRMKSNLGGIWLAGRSLDSSDTRRGSSSTGEIARQ